MRRRGHRGLKWHRSGDCPTLTPRLFLLVALAPAAIGLIWLAALLLLPLGLAAQRTAFAALVALLVTLAAIIAVEGTRRLRRERAANAAAIAEARRIAMEEARTAQARMRATGAHEIAAPLSGVIELIEPVATAPGLPPEARRKVSAALEAARDLAQLLGELAGMPDGAGTHLHSAPFRADEVMEGVVTLLGGRASSRGLALTTSVAPGMAPVWIGDAARLRQILVTLVVSALRFTDRGEIRLAARETAAGELALTVTDNGRGLPADQLNRLFEPSALSQNGSGLGLSLCQELARRMGGTVTAQSQEGRGSSFTVTLPLAKADRSALPARPGVTEAPMGVGAGAPLPVLVVDDVGANRLLLAAALARAGFAHAQAEDGAAALALVQSQPFAAVLMDVQMPGMDGLEATRRIRALPPPLGRLRVIGVTADRSAAGEAAARAAGMDAYLGKPVTVAELSRLLIAPAGDGWNPARVTI